MLKWTFENYLLLSIQYFQSTWRLYIQGGGFQTLPYFKEDLVAK